MKIQPYGFPLKWQFNGSYIAYENIKEISQGGPEIATLKINGVLIDGLYGGPPLFFKESIYVPLMKKNFWGKIQFVVAKIRLNDLKTICFNNPERLILLDKIENNKLFYFTNLDCNKTLSISLQKYKD